MIDTISRLIPDREKNFSRQRLALNVLEFLRFKRASGVSADQLSNVLTNKISPTTADLDFFKRNSHTTIQNPDVGTEITRDINNGTLSAEIIMQLITRSLDEQIKLLDSRTQRQLEQQYSSVVSDMVAFVKAGNHVGDFTSNRFRPTERGVQPTEKMALKITGESFVIRGPKDQDRARVLSNQDGTVSTAVVADGVTQNNSSGLVADGVVKAAVHSIQNSTAELTLDEYKNIVESTLQNRVPEIHTKIPLEDRTDGLASTIAISTIVTNPETGVSKLWYLWAGDSPIYLITRSGGHELTVADDHVKSLREQASITSAQETKIRAILTKHPTNELAFKSEVIQSVPGVDQELVDLIWARRNAIHNNFNLKNPVSLNAGEHEVRENNLGVLTVSDGLEKVLEQMNWPLDDFLTFVSTKIQQGKNPNQIAREIIDKIQAKFPNSGVMPDDLGMALQVIDRRVSRFTSLRNAVKKLFRN